MADRERGGRKVICGLDIDWIGRMNGCLEVALSRMQFGRFPAIDWDRTKRERLKEG